MKVKIYKPKLDADGCLILKKDGIIYVFYTWLEQFKKKNKL